MVKSVNAVQNDKNNIENMECIVIGRKKTRGTSHKILSHERA
jgi:hypothetical protein